MKPYPNPCDSCERCTELHGCQKWKLRFRRIWKEFNGYPVRAYRKYNRQKNEKFCYEHPDIVRRYLEKGPCEKCPKALDCDVPCLAYWYWWDARMEWMKGKFQNELR